jgi:hypothetical protein
VDPYERRVSKAELREGLELKSMAQLTRSDGDLPDGRRGIEHVEILVSTPEED